MAAQRHLHLPLGRVPAVRRQRMSRAIRIIDNPGPQKWFNTDAFKVQTPFTPRLNPYQYRRHHGADLLEYGRDGLQDVPDQGTLQAGVPVRGVQPDQLADVGQPEHDSRATRCSAGPLPRRPATADARCSTRCVCSSDRRWTGPAAIGLFPARLRRVLRYEPQNADAASLLKLVQRHSRWIPKRSSRPAKSQASRQSRQEDAGSGRLGTAFRNQRQVLVPTSILEKADPLLLELADL